MDGKEQKNYVYLLTFASGKSYVGVSNNPKRRLMEHWSRSEAGTYALSYALKKYGNPQMRILAETQTKLEAFALEIKFIAEMNTLAPNGYNMTKGGEGADLPPERYTEMGKRYSEMLRINPDAMQRRLQAAKSAGPKVSNANKKFYATDAGKECIRKRSQSSWKENVTKANQQPKTQASLQKASILLKEKWQDEEYRAQVNSTREQAQATLRATNPQWVQAKAEKMSESMKKKWSEPEFRERMKTRPAPVLSPESRKQAQAKQKQFWTEEQRAIAAEKTRLSWEKRRKQNSDTSQEP